MQDNFRTIVEMAAEWGISSRHIQFLCRSGKIGGAVKRAGAWFIPGDMTSPAKNSKADAEGFDFVGTKKRIFYNSIELFLEKGFDNVSLIDIASSVGIRQSTIYNHFRSKQEILDTIYALYRFYFLESRPSIEDMEPRLRSESLTKIMGYIRYEFKPEFMQAMSDISKIIFQRISIDSQARAIAKDLIIDEGIRYVEELFDRMIKIGRISAFDTHKMAVFINGIRIFTLFFWIVDPSLDSMMKLGEDELALYDSAVKLLTDLMPPK